MKIIQRNLIIALCMQHYIEKNQLLDAIVLNCSYVFRKGLMQFLEGVPILNLSPN